MFRQIDRSRNRNRNVQIDRQRDKTTRESDETENR